jgi:dTDP-4-amino-4,6-dideoxygalactose transaminase
MTAAAPIPFVALDTQFAAEAEALIPKLRAVLAGGQWVGGDEVAGFEARIADLCGVDHAVAVGSGTDALILALRALGIGPGDEVICPAFTFYATAEAIARVGATPVFADIDPVS